MCRMDCSQGQLQEAVDGVRMEPHVVSMTLRLGSLKFKDCPSTVWAPSERRWSQNTEAEKKAGEWPSVNVYRTCRRILA